MRMSGRQYDFLKDNFCVYALVYVLGDTTSEGLEGALLND